MKNLLFIGDLRTANNYGAVATTEALDRLLKNECYDINIKYIDFRSLYHPTPVDGLETGTTNKWLVAKKKAASYLSPSTILLDIPEFVQQKEFLICFRNQIILLKILCPINMPNMKGIMKKCKKVYVYSMKSGCWNGQILFISMEKVI